MISYWRQEGGRESLLRAVREAGTAVLSRRAVKVLARPCDGDVAIFPASLEARCEEIGAARLAEIDHIMYHPTRVLRARFRRGERCFLATVDGRPGNYEWVVPGDTQPHVAGLALRPDQCYIYNGRTVRAWRGKRLHTFLLTAICAQLGQEGFREAYARADASNLAALRAIERAGFRTVATLCSWRFLGLRHERVIRHETTPGA